ncbi:phage repressor protein C with HTH and peptisase S24 domain [Rhizobium subbaraonis]|uniref:Phage repressor protein C with HTH and peptisase S24 domain n=1 Tax=Rhizobium subbaraonis TaxID=908946 RepID=A0A285UPJ3_9HYPH|nr:helix-turn-helix domain-containing protein [Rhizobium subbaraonis]SOC43825.1 phage repressor protein C with HTH and peptisase S24 domain [Rhizobium subbaraonis]
MVGISYNTIMETIGSRIRHARKAAGMTQQALADELGIDRVNISQWESDITRPATERIPQMVQLLNISETWLFSGTGVAPTLPEKSRKRTKGQAVQIVPGEQLLGTGRMPIYAAAMGGDGHVIVTFDPIDSVKRPAELENVRGGYGLLIAGESMVPAFWPGDMALVNPNLPPARNRNVILYHTPPHGGDVEAIVKQLNGWNDREWHLQQYNPLSEFSEFRQEWPICHRVVGKYDAR